MSHRRNKKLILTFFIVLLGCCFLIFPAQTRAADEEDEINLCAAAGSLYRQIKVRAGGDYLMGGLNFVQNDNGVKLFWLSQEDLAADGSHGYSRLYCGINNADSQSCPDCNTEVTASGKVCCVLKEPRDADSANGIPLYKVVGSTLPTAIAIADITGQMAAASGNMDLVSDKCCCYNLGTKDEDCKVYKEVCPQGMDPIYDKYEYMAKCGSSVDTILQIPIPTITGNALQKVDSYGQYINTIYQFLIILGSILAFLSITISGFFWILAAGDKGKIQKLRDNIKNSLIALALLSCCYLVLNLVNPQLLSLSLKISPVSPLDIKKRAVVDEMFKKPADEEPTTSATANYTGYSTAYSAGGVAGGFQPDAEYRWDDAADELKQFINCIRDQGLPLGDISSISERNNGVNCPTELFPEREGYKQCGSQPCCVHAYDSCHYGGPNCRGASYAIDIAGNYSTNNIRIAARACEPKAYVLPETNPNHVHVSIGRSLGCGCD